MKDIRESSSKLFREIVQKLHPNNVIVCSSMGYDEGYNLGKIRIVHELTTKQRYSLDITIEEQCISTSGASFICSRGGIKYAEYEFKIDISDLSEKKYEDTVTWLFKYVYKSLELDVKTQTYKFEDLIKDIKPSELLKNYEN